MTQKDALDRSEWQYVRDGSLDALKAEDWTILNRQRSEYYHRYQASHVLRLLEVNRNDPTFGYRLNNYHHCLQAASLAHHAGEDEETVVVALLHDIGFTVCPDSHGEFSAALLKPYISDRNYWMLLHHALFQNYHCIDCPGVDRDARDRFRDSPHFEWTAYFVERFDQVAIQPHLEILPLEVFRPMVQRLFNKRPDAEEV